MKPLSPAEVADRLAISDVLHLYSRGIDRCDAETLREVFWPDGTCDYGSGAQNAYDWSDAVTKALSAMNRTQHALANMIVELAGERARAETYCTAYHEIPGANGPQEVVVGGRYLDRFEKRGGDWRITERLYVMDWNRNVPSTAVWDQGMYAGLTRQGARKPDDPFYRTRQGPL